MMTSYIHQRCCQVYIYAYTMVKPFIKGIDRNTFMHIHLQTSMDYTEIPLSNFQRIYHKV